MKQLFIPILHTYKLGRNTFTFLNLSFPALPKKIYPLRQHPLSVFDHIVGLALKGLRFFLSWFFHGTSNIFKEVFTTYFNQFRTHFPSYFNPFLATVPVLYSPLVFWCFQGV